MAKAQANDATEDSAAPEVGAVAETVVVNKVAIPADAQFVSATDCEFTSPITGHVFIFEAGVPRGLPGYTFTQAVGMGIETVE